MTDYQEIPASDDPLKEEGQIEESLEETRTEPLSAQPRKFLAMPGTWLALGLILTALVLFIVALAGKGKAPNSASTPAPDETAVLLIPQVTREAPTEIPATQALLQAEPTQTVTPTQAPRGEVILYTIAEGETIFSIADKFGLSPETIFWSNIYELGEDLQLYVPGVQLYILPVDGTYHQWFQGEGLNGVSEFYGVTPDTIIDYLPNKLNRASLGELSLPSIPAGTRLIVPGGTRPELLSVDGLLSYAAQDYLKNLPVGTPEEYPAPREQVIAYIVEPGETIFTVADDFGLKPESVLWANRYLVGDTPDGIYVGQKLIIVPADGLIHGWSMDENLDKVASFYQVNRDAILDAPLNQLDRGKFPDLSHPNIRPGTMLFVPEGQRPAATWVTAVSASDDGVGGHPNVSYLGAYACNSTATAVGSGSWVYPTTETWISGYEYNPPVHNGLDYAGRSGYSLFAADTGVVIYAGWSDRGYGNTIVVDHGNGYLSLYAHILDGGVIASCGSIVSSGELIGLMGSTGKSTGPHLHFEIRYNGSPVNPHSLGL